MDQLQLPQAKLLYLIAELYKTHDIDEQQKTRLKEMVILNNQKLYEALDGYKDNNDFNGLKETILGLVEDNEANGMD